MEMFPMVAKTFQGLEEVLAQELIGLQAKNVEIGQRMVSFEGDKRLMYKANLALHTALRILKPIAKFTAEDTDDLYDTLRDFDWSQYISPENTFMVDVTLSGNRFTNSRFATYRVKDAIVDHFMDKNGIRPSVCVEGADIRLNVHIQENRVTVSLDSSGEPLCKRGYKVEQTEAPINEVLAAGIIMMTGWRGDVDFVDPMCGSGTFLTEAALIAANINPGIYRQGFGFEKWADFDEELFDELYNDDSEERDVTCRIMGGDKDATSVAIARANVKNAKLENMITVERRDIEEWTENSPEGVLVTNPPYGRRLRPGDMDSLWKMIGRCLKENFKGWHAWVIGLEDEQFAEMGLKPSLKVPLHNGALECSLREFVMFAGRYADFRADGGSVSHDRSDIEETLSGVARGHHFNDREWREETKKFQTGKPRKFRDDRESSDFKGRDRGGRRDDRSGGKKDFRKEGRFEGKRDFRKEDRNGGRNDFRKNDRFEGKKERFEGKKEFRRDDRGGARKDFRKGDRKEGRGQWKGREARTVTDRGPSLSEFNETRFYEPGMRPRKRTRQADSYSEDED